MQYLRQFFQVLFHPIWLLCTSPQQLIATPRRLLGLSLAARVAILVAMFLVLATLAIFYQALKQDEAWSRYVSILSVLSVLSLVIPVVTYQTLKLWLEGETSEFQDIDRAWQAGVAELERNGIEVSRLPLFLLIGSPGEFTERALFDAAKLSLTVRQFPEGDSALHWYATGDALYLVASKVGCLSKVAGDGERAVESDRKHSGPPEADAAREPRPAPVGDLRMTMGAVPDIRETMASAALAPPPSAAGRYRGTMEFNPVDDSRLAPGTAQLVAVRESVHLSHEEWQAQPRRLRYLCQLIRRARQPFCPINGVVALLPYAVIQRGDDDASEVRKSAREDITTLSQALRLRYPLIALVTGMESEDGFCELVRRVGPERAKRQRFGKGFVVWDDATSEQLGALCIHACGAFETFIYEMFKERGALTSEDKTPGNRKLYTLLCRIRRNFQDRLDDILAQGFAQDPEQNGQAAGPLFGGCYFAATGDTAGSQGFARGVLRDRLTDPEERDGPLYEDLEWSQSMLREDAWYRRLAYAGFVLDTVLLAAAAGAFFLL
ncbi:MAG TPA: type VI secretion protein IcmF/TssM N-terminal domain-containing protein [Pirellulales bacterium]|nr:type VI secretion protein IcmF/TssM N-terminal domain-containing protein [Pirellulales bacterium]